MSTTSRSAGKHDSPLAAARARDSKIKRERALKACEALLADGIPITHTSVARKAQVSPWLTYNVAAIRSAIEQGRAKQERDGLATPIARSGGRPASRATLHTDLLLARKNLADLRDENKVLRKRLERQLGAEVEGTTVAELLERVQDLERVHRRLNEEAADQDKVIALLRKTVAELEADSEAKSELIRSMVHAKNTGS